MEKEESREGHVDPILMVVFHPRFSLFSSDCGLLTRILVKCFIEKLIDSSVLRPLHQKFNLIKTFMLILKGMTDENSNKSI